MTITPSNALPAVAHPDREKKPGAFEAAMTRALSSLKAPTDDPAPQTGVPAQAGGKVFDVTSIKQLDAAGAPGGLNNDLRCKATTDALSTAVSIPAT